MGKAFHQHLENPEQGYNLLSSIHIYVGLVLIALIVVRVIVRVISPTRPSSRTDSPRLACLANGLHQLLYLLMFLVPVLGSSAWFLGIHLLGEVHEITINIMMLLVLVHALAALCHHWLLKDDSLLKMLGRK